VIPVILRRPVTLSAGAAHLAAFHHWEAVDAIETNGHPP
jgi:hypothetical protein